MSLAGWLRRRGGLWVKLGQILSLRLDVPPRLRARLTLLQSAKGVGSVATVTREQIDGRWRAVKRVTPETRARYARQLRRLGWMVAVAHPLLPRLRLKAALRMLRATLAEELDLRYEASQARELRTLLKGSPVTVPKVSRRRSTEDVLVSEWVDGVLLTDYLSGAPTSAFNRQRVAERLMASTWTQLFANAFHRDLHPGNVLVRTGNRIALIDVNVGHVDATFLQTFMDQLRALVGGEYRWAAELTLLLCSGIDFPRWWYLLPPQWQLAKRTRHTEQLLDDITGAFRRWMQRARVDTLSYADRSLMSAMEEVSAAVLKARGRFRWEWFDVQRTLITLDGTIAQLDPDLDMLGALRDALPACLPVPDVRRLPEYVRLETARLRMGAFLR